MITAEEFKALLIRSMEKGVSVDQLIRDQALKLNDEGELVDEANKSK